MTTFGLVHGAWHGGWCWQRLIPELEALGHRAVGMDLPTDDPHAGAERYAAIVLQALDGVDQNVVLVGHSLAGLVIPAVASMRPVRHLVFLCALVPRPRRQLESPDAPSRPAAETLRPDFADSRRGVRRPTGSVAR